MNGFLERLLVSLAGARLPNVNSNHKTQLNRILNYDGTTFKNYTTADGLVNNSVFSMLEDKAGNLWFGTRWFGLSRFDGKAFTTFSEYQEE